MDMDENKPTEKTELGMLRIDLQDSLRQSSVDPRKLSSFQRILLTTDGTVTEILEAQLWEAIHIVKLFQDITDAETAIPFLDIGPGTRIMVRKVLLRGKYSHKNYIYAESILVPERLPDNIRESLMETQKPIGQLIMQNRMESFREILTCKLEEARELSEYFDIPDDAMLVSRTYRVFANRQPIMLITEKFPEAAFQQTD
ncbi:chorismate lyase [Thiogranum longum]|uniref:Chorismate lyase n=1 Tax=Thiogranum longum TaxID=1537524 RepID=A0A4R1H8L3_9GAMM|nr:chorismate pyruvate-lyase family protein [Thiogranum longum]TCK18177.1 chorismate lyase [Thiogranum longum]